MTGEKKAPALAQQELTDESLEQITGGAFHSTTGSRTVVRVRVTCDCRSVIVTCGSEYSGSCPVCGKKYQIERL